MSKTSKIFVGLLLAATTADDAMAGARSPTPAANRENVDPQKAVRSLIDAEIAYAKLAQEKGFRAASIHVFADDGVVFAPGPVNGKQFWQKEAEEPILIWQPIFATVTQRGDLGYTTGPWESKKARGDAKPTGFGQFFTIWRKEADGNWKVVLDLGIEHPQPTEPSGNVETLLPTFSAADAESARRKLHKAERAFTDALKIDAGAAVIAAAADDIRILRRNVFPAVGSAAARLMLAADHGKTSRARAGHGMSRSNDLAYDYGKYSSERGNLTERGVYVSIWRPDNNGDWKIGLDLQKKAAEPKQ